MYNPRNIEEYISFYSIEDTGDTVRLFKAVHKRDGKYFSAYDQSFEYVLGAKCEAQNVSTDITKQCAEGIHLAYRDWCILFGFYWPDLAILEIEAKKAEIVVPLYGDGKVRTKSAKVIREVPLEECGLVGKILKKRNEK